MALSEVNMKTYALTFLLLSALTASNAHAQLITGTDTGAIPDGAGAGPNNFGAP